MFRMTVRIFAVVLISSFVFAGQIGAPYIKSISPASAPAGSQTFVMTITGANFTQGSVVRWNGVDQQTTYVSPRQLQITVASTYVATPGTVSITVYTYGRNRSKILAKWNVVRLATRA